MHPLPWIPHDLILMHILLHFYTVHLVPIPTKKNKPEKWEFSHEPLDVHWSRKKVLLITHFEDLNKLCVLFHLYTLHCQCRIFFWKNHLELPFPKFSPDPFIFFLVVVCPDVCTHPVADVVRTARRVVPPAPPGSSRRITTKCSIRNHCAVGRFDG